MAKPDATKTVGEFGPDNLQIVETPERVTISFDPRVLQEKPFNGGRKRIASTGSFEKFRTTGIRIMLHVGTIVG